MEDFNPLTIAFNVARTISTGIAEWVSDRASDLANFLGLTPSFASSPVAEPYTPPFTGGQCTFAYRGILDVRTATNPNQRLIYSWGPGGSGSFIAVGANPPTSAWGSFAINGKITGATFDLSGSTYRFFVNGVHVANRVSTAGTVTGVNIAGLVPSSGGADSCGDLPNPSPPLPTDYGLRSGGENYDSDDLLPVYEGSPIVTASGLLAALAAIAEAVKNIADVLQGIKKIGEAIAAIKKLLDELFNDKKERDKKDPSKKDRLTAFWRQCNSVDGYIFLNPVPIGAKLAYPYKIQFVVESFPPTSSRILGVNAPSISIDSLPLFYLYFQDDSSGIQSIKEIRVLNSVSYLPPYCTGIFWNFRLNPSAKAKFRLFYEVETEEEEV